MPDQPHQLPFRDGLHEHIIVRDGNITKYQFPNGVRADLTCSDGRWYIDIVHGADVQPSVWGVAEDDATAKLLQLVGGAA